MMGRERSPQKPGFWDFLGFLAKKPGFSAFLRAPQKPGFWNCVGIFGGGLAGDRELYQVRVFADYLQSSVIPANAGIHVFADYLQSSVIPANAGIHVFADYLQSSVIPANAGIHLNERGLFL